MRITVATGITCIRIVLTPFIVSTILHGSWFPALGLLVIAALSDVCDGVIARSYQQESAIGAYLDPFADKFLLIACYTTLWYVSLGKTSVSPFPGWLLCCLLIRESILISGGIYAIIQQGIQATSLLRPTLSGKLTTVLHTLVLCTWILTHCIPIPAFFLLASSALVIGCMICSAVEYIQRWRQVLLLSLLGTVMINSCAETSFTQEAKTTKKAFRQKYREELLELFATYAQLLSDELYCLTQASIQDSFNPEQRAIRYAQLHRTVHFMETGQDNKNCSDPCQTVCDMIQLIHVIAQVQQRVLATIRCLLENDTKSLFVKARARTTFENYIHTVQRLVQETQKSKQDIQGVGMHNRRTDTKSHTSIPEVQE